MSRGKCFPRNSLTTLLLWKGWIRLEILRMKAGFPVSLDSVNRILNMYSWRLSRLWTRVTMAPEHNHILIEITGLGSGHLFTITLLVGLHGNKMSLQSSLSLCKEHCPITLQASYSIWSLSQTSLASVFGGCQICQLFWDGIEWTIGYRCTGYCSVANCSSRLFFCENLGDFLAKIWAKI